MIRWRVQMEVFSRSSRIERLYSYVTAEKKDIEQKVKEGFSNWLILHKPTDYYGVRIVVRPDGTPELYINNLDEPGHWHQDP